MSENYKDMETNEIEENESENSENADVTEECSEELGDIKDLDPAELEKEVEKLTATLSESDERYLRIVAEYENYRKRTTKEKDAIYPLATADTVSKFLPVLDSFERALEFDFDSEDFSKGIELIHQNFKDVLESLGAESFGEIGDPFDPDLHNAVMHIENPELGENVVSLVLQRGYKIGDRIVRHAVVQTAN